MEEIDIEDTSDGNKKDQGASSTALAWDDHEGLQKVSKSPIISGNPAVSISHLIGSLLKH